MFTQSGNGSAMPCNPYSSEKDRKEVEVFRNIERQAAYELRKEGYTQPIIWRQK